MINLVKKIGRLICYDFYKIMKWHVPRGHFYSPIPSLSEIRRYEKQIWKEEMPRELPGIELNIKEQLQLLEEFKEYYKELPFKAKKADTLRYYFENIWYSYADAICLYCMIRKVKPKQIIEIGSGYSSSVMMDTNELYFDDKIKICFVEPYPQALFSIMKESDKYRYRILPVKLQDCLLTEFSILQENDILFIDSTHVSKINSDVNRLFFEILPKLNKGVYIHFHDIFYPFEYPKEFVYKGWSWNENYLLRAFLEYNDSFKIVYFNTFMQHFYKNKLESEMPMFLKKYAGNIQCILWLKKIR